MSESSVSAVVDIVRDALDAAEAGGAGEAGEAGDASDAGGALERRAMLGARLATAQPRRAARLALPLLRLNARLPVSQSDHFIFTLPVKIQLTMDKRSYLAEACLCFYINSFIMVYLADKRRKGMAMQEIQTLK